MIVLLNPKANRGTTTKTGGLRRWKVYQFKSGSLRIDGVILSPSATNCSSIFSVPNFLSMYIPIYLPTCSMRYRCEHSNECNSAMATDIMARCFPQRTQLLYNAWLVPLTPSWPLKNANWPSDLDTWYRRAYSQRHNLGVNSGSTAHHVNKATPLLYRYMHTHHVTLFPTVTLCRLYSQHCVAACY
jgi:hypothetical protein